MPIVVFDTETGGLLPQHPTIQIAALAVDENWNTVDSFERKIQFDPATATAEALESNCYDESLWIAEAMPPNKAWFDFSNFLKRHGDLRKISKRGTPYTATQLCGHNAASFDLPRVTEEFKRDGLYFPGDYQVLDTMHLYLWLCLIRGKKISAKLTGDRRGVRRRSRRRARCVGRLPDDGGHRAEADRGVEVRFCSRRRRVSGDGSPRR